MQFKRGLSAGANTLFNTSDELLHPQHKYVHTTRIPPHKR